MSDEPPRARAMECTVAEYAELERWCRAKILAALDGGRMRKFRGDSPLHLVL